MHTGPRGALETICVSQVSDLTQVLRVFIMRLGALVACMILGYNASPRQFPQDCELVGSRWWHRLLRPCSKYVQHPEGAQWAGSGHCSVRTHSSSSPTTLQCLQKQFLPPEIQQALTMEANQLQKHGPGPTRMRKLRQRLPMHSLKRPPAFLTAQITRVQM